MRIGLVLVLGIAAGCGRPAAGPTPLSTPPTPVPWIADVTHPTPFPVPTQTPRPTGVRGCGPADLIGVYDGGQGAGGWATRVFLIGNRSSTPCIVDAPTRVAYQDAQGVEIVARSIESSAPNTGWVVIAASTEPVAGSPRREGQALIGLATYGDCGPAVAVASVKLSFAEPTKEIVIRMEASRPGGRCDVPEELLSLGVFAPLGPVATPFPAYTPAPQRLAFSIDAPPTATAGASFDYVVRIRNVSTEPYTWDDGCPDYIESLLGHEVGPTDHPSAVSKSKSNVSPMYVGVAKERHSLNCVAAGAIQPGAEVAFTIRLSVPADARGLDNLHWEIVGERNQGSASTPIAIN